MAKARRNVASYGQVYRARVTLAKQGVDGRKPVDALSSASIAAAREAWFRGDAVACLSLLDEVVTSEPLCAEFLFLRARALLVLKRSDEAVKLLEPRLPTFEVADEACTARMLHGHAIARSEHRPDRGLALLADAAADGERWRVHRAIRAEIAYYQALAHWTKQDYDQASILAIRVEGARMDILSVRATQLRAFIALAAGHHSDALSLFRRAHAAYGSCRGRDVDLATRVLVQIASLEQMLRSAAVPGTHAMYGGRTIAGSSWGPAVATPERLFLCYLDAWLFALDGNDRQAYRLMREAEFLAPTVAWRVWALAGRAIIATLFGEIAAGWDFANTALDLQKSIDWDETNGEERLGLLQLAEVYGYLDPAEAAHVLARYDAVVTKIDGQSVFHDRNRDPRLRGWESYTRGLIARGNGDTPYAGDLLRDAATIFEACGCLWFEALALIELDATKVQTRGRTDIERAARIIRDNFPQSFLARRLGRWANMYFDPIAGELSAAERDVLRHFLEGLSHAQIAAKTNRATRTVKKHMEKLHAAFETNDRAQLIAECYRRGLGPPSWADDAPPMNGWRRRTGKR